MRSVLSVASVVLAVGVLSAQSPSTVQSGPTRPVSSERFEDFTRSHQEKHDLEREALTRARETTNLRLDEMNNLRLQIGQERGIYVTRVQFEAMAERLNKAEQAIASAQSATFTWMAALGVFLTVMQVGFRFLPRPDRAKLLEPER